MKEEHVTLTLRFVKLIPECNLSAHFDGDLKPYFDTPIELPGTWSNIVREEGGDRVFFYMYVNEATEIKIYEVVETVWHE